MAQDELDDFLDELGELDKEKELIKTLDTPRKKVKTNSE